nr:hypothetical protein [Tanacetum cinerariifolium]
FWNTAMVKSSGDVTRLQALVDKKRIVNDVTRLQALVDKKKVVVTEATIREALRLDDAECIDCKGFSEVETPLFEGMLVEQQGDEEGDADENVKEVNAGDAVEGDDSAAHGDISAAHREVPIVAEEQ